MGMSVACSVAVIGLTAQIPENEDGINTLWLTAVAKYSSDALNKGFSEILSKVFGRQVITNSPNKLFGKVANAFYIKPRMSLPAPVRCLCPIFYTL